MKNFYQFVQEAKKGRCWTGYKPVPGKAPYSDGSCEKIKEHVVKTGSGYKLVSKKTGKNLGTATSKAGIMKREREVEYFKHMKEDGEGCACGAPTNNVGSGNIAGTGGKAGEPGVNPKKKKSPILMGLGSREPPKI
jgi:hypothetical protein